MKVLWASKAWDDYVGWQQENAAIAQKINDLIKDARRDPFGGIGKPEALKGPLLQGWWSRRITDEHRLVYRVTGTANEAKTVEIAQCRFHYDRQ